MGSFKKFHTPSLDYFNYDKDSNLPPSMDNLPYTISANSTSVSPTFRYRGGSSFMNLSTCNPDGYGKVLNISGSGQVPMFIDSPFHGQRDGTTYLYLGQYYGFNDNQFANITTEDIVFEVILVPPGDLRQICGKAIGSTTARRGYDIYGDGSSLVFDVRSGNSNQMSASTGPLSTLSTLYYHHAMVFINRDENTNYGAQWFINGVAVGSGANFNNVTGSLTSNTPFILGATESGTNVFSRKICFLSLYKKDNWFAAGNNLTIWGNIAKERFYRLTGVWPRQSRGTSMPSLITRGGNGFVEKFSENLGYTRYHPITSNWPRVVSRKEKNTSRIVRGYLSEKNVTNYITNSQLLSSWTLVNLTSATGGGADGPQGTPGNTLTYALNSLVGNGTSGTHGVTQGVSVTSPNKWCFSAFVKVGNKNFCYLSCDNVANSYAYFNLLTGKVGTVGAGLISSGIEDWGSGLYRIFIVFSGQTSGTMTVQIAAAQSDGSLTFTGDTTTVNIYAGCSQLELGDYPTSYIIATAAATTRLADQMRVVANDGNFVNAISSSVSVSLECMTNDLTVSGSNSHSCLFATSNEAYEPTVNYYGLLPYSGLLNSTVPFSRDASNYGISNRIYKDRIVIGSYAENINGRAYIYERVGSSWVQMSRLDVPDSPQTTAAVYGYSCDTYGDYVVVGAPYQSNSGYLKSGAVYIYKKNNSTQAYDYVSKLVSPNPLETGSFGYSVSIHSSSILVTSQGENPGSLTNAGAAYIFTGSDASWGLQQYITASDKSANARYGFSGTINGDDAVVGAYAATVGANGGAGKVYIYTRSGSSWTQQQFLTASDNGVSYYFGDDVSIDGNYLVVGSYYASPGSVSSAGEAYIFKRTGSVWTEQKKLILADAAVNDYFGRATKISGSTILCGAHWKNAGPITIAGKGYIFDLNGNLLQTLTASNLQTADYFGAYIDYDSGSAVISCYGRLTDGVLRGASCVYTSGSSGFQPQQTIYSIYSSSVYVPTTNLQDGNSNSYIISINQNAMTSSGKDFSLNVKGSTLNFYSGSYTTSSATRIDIGSSELGFSQPNGIISKFRVYPYIYSNIRDLK